MELREKKAIVTGGANGIGRCVVEKLSAEKAIVGVIDFDENALAEVKRSIPEICILPCDITIPDQVNRAINRFYDEFGGLDILINNAGMIHNALLLNMHKDADLKADIGVWDKVIATNLNSVYYVTAYAVRKMLLKRTKGVIINISSIAAQGNLGQGAYSAAKAGVGALVVTWAKELGLLGIRVAGIAPGFTKTDAAMTSMSADVLEDWISRTPLKRLADPNEIAEGVLFILHDDFFNGRILELDGGLRI
jgi:3-oxoacyl-[acyl-carrier protein] reductase